MAVNIQLRRGTAAEWTSANPTLMVGELGYETDTGFYKIGNGSTAWTSLSYNGLSGTVTLTQVNVTGGTDINAAIADADQVIVYDDSATANRKSAVTRIPTYVFTKISGDVTVNSSGVAAIGSGVIVNADIANATISSAKIDGSFTQDDQVILSAQIFG